MKLFFLLPFMASAYLIPQITHKCIMRNKNHNETKDDSALIPKKDIPKHPLIWEPTTYYIY